MKKAVALITGIGIGGVLMFLLDPHRGRRRRALVLGRLARAANASGGAIGRTSRDFARGASGVVSMAGKMFRGAEAARPASRLGRMGRGWAPAWRVVAGAAGGAFSAYCFTRRHPLGKTAGVLGATLAARGITNRRVSRLFGLIGRRAAA